LSRIPKKAGQTPKPDQKPKTRSDQIMLHASPALAAPLKVLIVRLRREPFIRGIAAIP
jgi:hypothetical protein